MRHLLIATALLCLTTASFADADAEARKKAVAEAQAAVEAARAELLEAEKGLLEAKQALYGEPANRGFLGLIMEGSPVSEGIVITRIVPDSGAEEAGVKPGDLIIGVRGEEVIGSDETDRLHNGIASLGHLNAGDKVPLTLIRDGKTIERTVTAKAKPMQFVMMQKHLMTDELPTDLAAIENTLQVLELDRRGLVEEERIKIEGLRERLHAQASIMQESGFQHFKSYAWLRQLKMVALSPELGRYFGSDSGVLILNAPEDNPFGLQVGDVVTKVDGSMIDSPKSLMVYMYSYAPGAKLVLKLMRDNKPLTLDLKMPEQE